MTNQQDRDARPAAAAVPETSAARPVVSQGWLGERSMFETPTAGRLSRAMSASVIGHGLLVLAAILALAVQPNVFDEPVRPPLEYKVVFLEQPGPGGGGGGSPAPAPPKVLEIPRPKPAEPVPVVPPPPVEAPPPPPTLNAPVQTNLANLIQAAGENSVSLARFGGGGRGGGIGSGTGTGLGDGTGGGFGGGAYQPGNGVSNPTPVRRAEPRYTSEAMRAKIQGEVELEVVVEPNGTVGDVRIVKSLDARHGLDQEAVKAARNWLFRPGTFQGKPVATIVTLILEFRLH